MVYLKESYTNTFVQNYKLEIIGSSAFYSTALTSITIPNTVTSIGSYVFYYCASLESVTFAENSKLAIIPNSAFRSTALTSINIPSTVTEIGANAFNGSGLTSIDIPDTVTEIGANAFANCTSMTNATIGSGVTTISESMFRNNSKLHTVEFSTGSGLKEIKSNAFNSTGLTSVTIPDSVTTIGSFAFQNCTSLISATIGDGIGTVPQNLFSGCTNIAEITINNGITGIDASAFSGNAKLTKVTFEADSQLETIGGNAFENTSSLTSITLPSGVTTIGADAFERSGLTSITIPDSVTTLGIGAFADNASLATASTGDNVTVLPNDLFNGCVKLADVNIGSKVTEIGNNAFKNTELLTSITLPSGLETIGVNAFNGSGLTSIDILDSVTSIGDYAFANCASMKTATIGSGLMEIPSDMFYYNKLLHTVNFSEDSQLHTIGSTAFSGCEALTNIILPNDLLTIEHRVFINSGLTSIVIPNKVTTIEDYAFSNTPIVNIEIPNSVITLGQGALHSCKQLEYVVFAGTFKEGLLPGIDGRATVEQVQNPLNAIPAQADVFYKNSGLDSTTMSANWQAENQKWIDNVKRARRIEWELFGRDEETLVTGTQEAPGNELVFTGAELTQDFDVTLDGYGIKNDNTTPVLFNTTDHYSTAGDMNTNAGNYTLTVTVTEPYEDTFTQNYKILQSITDYETPGVETYLEGDYSAQEVAFTYGDNIAVKVTPYATGEPSKPQPTTLFSLMFSEPNVNQMALYVRENGSDTQISEPQTVTYVNGVFDELTFTIYTEDKDLAIGDNVIVAKYVESTNMDVHEELAQTITLSQKALSLPNATAANKEYDGNNNAVITAGDLATLESETNRTYDNKEDDILDTVSIQSPTVSGSFNAKDGKQAQDVGEDKVVTRNAAFVLQGEDMGWYTLTQPENFTADITKKPLDSTMITTVAEAVYDGTAQEPAITVVDGNPSIIEIADYTTEYTDNLNASTQALVTITATAEGNYSGTANKNFTVEQSVTDFEGGVTVDQADKTYTYGETITVTVKAYPTGESVNSSNSSIRSLIGEVFRLQPAPPINYVALYVRAEGGELTQIAEPQAVTNTDADFTTLTFAVDTKVKQLEVGENTIIAKYTGNNNMASHEEVVTVTLEQAVLTMSSAYTPPRTYTGEVTTWISGKLGAGSGILSFNETNDEVNLEKGVIDATFAQKDAGKNIVVTADEDFTLTGTHAKYYTLIQPTGLTADIWPKQLYVDTLVATDRDYKNKIIDVDVAVTLEGMVAGDTFVQGTGYTVTATMADDSAGVGKNVNVTIALEDTTNNYFITENDANQTTTVTINKIALENAPTTDVSSARFGTSGTLDLTTWNSLEGVSFNNIAVTDPAQGETAIISGAPTITNGELNYTLVDDISLVGTTQDITFTVSSTNYNDINVTITVTMIDRIKEQLTVAQSGTTYGENLPDLVYDLNGATLTSITYKGVASTVYAESTTKPTDAGTYSVTVVTQTDTHEYTGTASFEIAKKALTATVADNQGKVYDGNNTITGVSLVLNGVLAADSLTATADGTSASENAGTREFTATNVNMQGTSLNNYSLATANVSGNVVITKAQAPAITFPTGGTDITYGSNLNTSTLTGGDTTYGTFAWTTPDIIPTVTNNGYEVSFTPSEATVMNYQTITTLKATVGVTVDKAVPETLTTELVSMSGPESNRVVTLKATITNTGDGVLPTGDVVFTYGNPTKNIGTAELVNGVATIEWTVTTADTYEVTATYQGDSNYSTKTANFSVNTARKEQAELVVTEPESKTYGDQSFELTTTGGSGTGVITYAVTSGDAVSVSGNTVTIEKAGRVTITATKAGDDEYNDKSADLTIVVAQKQLSWNTAGEVEGKVYDATKNATVKTNPTLSGIVANDDVSVDGTNAVTEFDSVNASSAVSVSASGYSVTGSDIANYLLPTNQPEFENAAISKKDIDVTVTAKEREFGKTNPALTFTVDEAMLEGADDRDDLAVTLSTDAGVNSDVGEYDITGVSASMNYNVSFTNAKLTVIQADYTVTEDKNVELKYSNTAEQTVDFTDLIPANAGGVTGIIVSETTDLNSIIDETMLDADLSSIMFTLTNGLTNTNVGNTAKLSAVISSKNYKDFTVVVNVTLTDKEEQKDFAFDITEKAVAYGDADFTVVATGNVTESVVTYTSSDETVATVDEKGKVTVLKVGSAVIKAKASTTEDYNAAEDNYTLTVKKAPLTITVKDLDVYKGTYKGLNIPFVLEYNGFVKGEDESVLATTLSKPMAVVATDTSVAGEFDVAVALPTDADYNYEITTVSGTLKVFDRGVGTYPPQAEILDDINSDESLVSIPDETTFVDAEGTTVTPVEKDIRIAITSELTPEDKAALEAGLTDPQAGETRVALEVSLLENGKEIFPMGDIEIFIPYSAIAPITQETEIKILHLKSDGTYETIVPDMLEGGIRYTATSLSPFLFYNVNTAVAPSDPGSSDSAQPQKGNSTPQTGDGSNPFLYIVIMIVAFMGMSFVLIKKRRTRV